MFMKIGLAVASISIFGRRLHVVRSPGQDILIVIRRRHMLISAGLLLLCAVLVSMAAPAQTACAQETCAARCLDAFAACYKRTQNRTQCEQLRESCIKQCKK
jgi:hypothetical protein